MKNKSRFALLAVVVVVVVVAVLAFLLLNGQTGDGIPADCQQAMDSSMAHLFANHDVPFSFPHYGGWTTENTTPTGMVGSSTWLCTQEGWSVEVTYPVVPEPVYTVTIDYSQPGMGIPYHLHWEGTYHNGTDSMFTITETDFWLAE